MQTLMKHVNEKPESPSQLSELTIPPELDILVLQSLEKNPANRPSNAAELSAKLRAIPLDPPWVNEDARRWRDTHSPCNQ
jgi:hypothetical protein